MVDPSRSLGWTAAAIATLAVFVIAKTVVARRMLECRRQFLDLLCLLVQRQQPLPEVMDRFAHEQPRRLRRPLRRFARALSRGRSLGQALSTLPRMFSKAERRRLEGVGSATLAAELQALRHQQQRQQDAALRLIGLLLYPAFVGSGVLLITRSYQFQILKARPVDGSLIAGFSLVMNQALWVFVAVALLLLIEATMLRPGAVFSSLLTRLGIGRELGRLRRGECFLQRLAAALDARLPIAEAIVGAGADLGTRRQRRALAVAATRIDAGEDVGACLTEPQLAEGFGLGFLRQRLQSRSLCPEDLWTWARHCGERHRDTCDRLLRRLAPLILLFLGCVLAHAMWQLVEGFDRHLVEARSW